MEKTPQEAAGVARLKAWALDPARGGKILQLEAPGAWDRCQSFYHGKVPARMIDGWCAELIRDARGGQAPDGHPGKH